MLELGGLDFASPWLLLALTALPALWWLLRVTPPSPRMVSFPPVRLLMALRSNEETPSKTPWWLILLRMLLAALVILALAHPVLNPSENLRGSGPLFLVIDDGWASASDWPLRQQKMSELLNQAEREDRPVHILSTAVAAPGEPLQVSKLMPAANARRIATALAPKPWPADREAALAALEDITVDGSAHIVWIANGLGQEVDRAFAEALQQLGGLQVIEQPAAARVRLIQTPKAKGETLQVPVQRVAVPREGEVWVRAVTKDGRLVGRGKAVFSAGEKSAQALLPLSGKLRNEVTRIEIEGRSNAGETFLVDERWRRRPVGIVSGDSSETDQPLLSSIYYLDRALRPFAEVRQGTITELFKREVAVVVLADIGRLIDSDKATLDAWMKRGGITLRFAGPRLAAAEDDLVPVPLRGGGRAIGGGMSWAAPAKLLPMEESSPFSGLDTPPDVRVQRQVLAEPALDLNQKTWARLSDGTPLITAEKRGRGWLVLVHTTANTDWSNLPLSGLFVDILRRIVGLSAGVVSEDQTALLPPSQTLDGYGRLGAPSADAISISARDFSEARPGPATPPGYYGHNTGRRAFNIGTTTTDLKPIGDLPSGIERAGFVPAPSVDFKPWLLLSSLLLAIGDLLVSFVLRGLIDARRLTVTTAIAAFAVSTAITIPGPAVAQSASRQNTAAGPDAKALEATSKTRLAYVVTGDHKLDETTMAGLRGLSDILRRRTAVEPGNPMAIDIENDELAFFPLLYWAVSPRQPLLSEKARRRLNQFLKTGGTILFDTREREGFSSDSFGGVGAAGLHLRRLIRGLDVPALTHTPKDHVLRKAFYLLREFPGRWAGGPLWVERRGSRHKDGVSSIIIGANDWAGAWAVDSLGRPMAAVVPGGERQREMAYRFGVNWVMYALTGNYKTDQVHVPAIIDRLGQ